MNWLDVLIIISLIASFVGGLATGLIRSFLALIGVIAGIFVAGHLYSNLATHLNFIHHEGAASIIAFALIFLCIMLIATIIAQFLRKVVTRIWLGWLDRLLGGFAGLFAGAMLWGLLLALWAKFFGEATLDNSFVAPFLVAKIPLVLALLPAQFDSIREFFR